MVIDWIYKINNKEGVRVTLVFVSNYLTHHQKPFCDAMNQALSGNFTFISTMPFEQERLNMGWESSSESYELRSYLNKENQDKAFELLKNADAVIVGNAIDIKEIIKIRMSSNKLTFRYSERLYKKGRWRACNPKNWIRNWNENLRYINKQLYLLCASAYTAADFNLMGAYKKKAFKWGYFPEVKKHNINELMKNKMSLKSTNQSSPCALILWVGRFLRWKHPEVPVKLAEVLKHYGYNFDLKIIGSGELEFEINRLIEEKNLVDCVEVLGNMSPKNVRKYMEQADVFLFTSDFNEGWGAVLNEAMNSGCAVVASHSAGSTPFLVEHGVNGLIYRNGNNNDLLNCVKKLLDDLDYCHSLGFNAYYTMVDVWNSDEAANRLIELCKGINNNCIVYYDDGPCSRAEVLWNNWYKG